MPRPLLRPELRKNWTHSSAFYESEYWALVRHAERSKLTISGYIRRAVIEKMEKEK